MCCLLRFIICAFAGVFKTRKIRILPFFFFLLSTECLFVFTSRRQSLKPFLITFQVLHQHHLLFAPSASARVSHVFVVSCLLWRLPPSVVRKVRFLSSSACCSTSFPYFYFCCVRLNIYPVFASFFLNYFSWISSPNIWIGLDCPPLPFRLAAFLVFNSPVPPCCPLRCFPNFQSLSGAAWLSPSLSSLRPRWDATLCLLFTTTTTTTTRRWTSCWPNLQTVELPLLFCFCFLHKSSCSLLPFWCLSFSPMVLDCSTSTPGHWRARTASGCKSWDVCPNGC